MDYFEFRDKVTNIAPELSDLDITAICAAAAVWVGSERREAEDKAHESMAETFAEEREYFQSLAYDVATNVYRRHCDASERTTPLENVGGVWGELAMELSPVQVVQ